MKYLIKNFRSNRLEKYNFKNIDFVKLHNLRYLGFEFQLVI